VGIVAIDPGGNGSTCFLPSDGEGAVISFADHKKHNALSIYSFLEDLPIEYIVIEDVHSLYGMSAKSNFNFGFNLGSITAVAELQDVPLFKVQPKVWQKYIGCTKPSGKELKKEIGNIAITLYPTASIHGSRGGLLDGRSDALMIAHYAKHNIRIPDEIDT